MTGCCVCRKCRVACFLGEESQQPTWPHDLHSRNSTHTDPSARHSSHALGVFGGGNFSAVSPLMCSHASAINISCHRIASLNYGKMKAEPFKPCFLGCARLCLNLGRTSTSRCRKKK